MPPNAKPKELVNARESCDALTPQLVAYLKESMKGKIDEDAQYAFVVFGASGDLAKKKIYPTLWWLFRDSLLPCNVNFIGYARSDLNMEKLRDGFEGNCQVKESERSKFESFLRHCSYIRGQYDQSDGIKHLQSAISGKEEESGNKAVNRLFYLAVPPTVYMDVATQLKNNCMDDGDSWTRIVLEKPFGYNLSSARELSDHIATLFEEEQIYRIDHYLGKEIVQNIMVLRFGNRLFCPTWNRHHIESVLIDFKENIGTSGRAGYFEKAGMIRDVMQNHLLQLLTFAAMEKPKSLDADGIRNEKARLLQSIKPIDVNNVVIGQFVGDPDSENEIARVGYKDDPGVSEDSKTETFATAVLWIDNDRWRGVPFIMRCGKGLDESKSEIRMQYRTVEDDLYPQGALQRSEVIIGVKPNEGLFVKIMTKKPGLEFEVEDTILDMSYSSKYTDIRLPEAYERLFLEVFMGSQINFVRTDEVDYAWRIFSPLLEALKDKEPIKYRFGSTGPKESDALIHKYGFSFDGSY